MALARTKDDKTEQAEGHPLLGNSANPQPLDQPTDHGGQDTVDPTAAQVGSATQLNAFYQDLEDEIAKAHNAVNEIANKSKAYVARFQQG